MESRLLIKVVLLIIYFYFILLPIWRNKDDVNFKYAVFIHLIVFFLILSTMADLIALSGMSSDAMKQLQERIRVLQ